MSIVENEAIQKSWHIQSRRLARCRAVCETSRDLYQRAKNSRCTNVVISILKMGPANLANQIRWSELLRPAKQEMLRNPYFANCWMMPQNKPHRATNKSSLFWHRRTKISSTTWKSLTQRLQKVKQEMLRNPLFRDLSDDASKKATPSHKQKFTFLA